MHSSLSVEEVSAESRNNLDSLWTFLQICIGLCVLIDVSLFERILAIAPLHLLSIEKKQFALGLL
jgi:hypothetical protein